VPDADHSSLCYGACDRNFQEPAGAVPFGVLCVPGRLSRPSVHNRSDARHRGRRFFLVGRRRAGDRFADTRILLPSQADPQVAQAILTDIATSIMTVVSIVFAILLMTLTLASTQFSPRILISFIRDRVTQWTLGIFLGTFSYRIAALPAARSAPDAFVPVATVTGAMLLAPVCVGWLIYFIHHISNAISVNHIVDRIARETELVIDAVMPEPWRPVFELPPFGVVPEALEFVIASRRSGYIRFVDIPRLRSLALAYRVSLRLLRRVGHSFPRALPSCMFRAAIASPKGGCSSCGRRSKWARPGRCSRTSNSASSKSLTLRCGHYRPRSTTRRQRSAVSISSLAF
jgi:uncharacterized membrane protein